MKKSNLFKKGMFLATAVAALAMAGKSEVVAAADYVSEQDQEGGTPETNVLLTLGERTVGYLESQEDVDMFSFTTDEEEAFYEITLGNVSVQHGVKIWASDNSDLIGNINYYIEHNSWNEYLTKSLAHFESNQSQENTACLGKLKPETTYYITVRSSGGVDARSKYRLEVNKVATDEAGDTIEDATKLTLNKTLTASSPAYNDVDWYKFTATSTDRYEITCSNVDILKHPMHFEIWSTEDCMESDRVITNNEGWLEEKNELKKIVHLEAKNTYYIKVSSVSNGNYKIAVNELSASTNKTPVKVTAGTKKLTISWCCGQAFL